MHAQPSDALPKIMLARYYGGAVGRFSSVDPATESILQQNPQSWNRCAYVLANPIRMIDPQGEVATVTVDADNQEIRVTASIDLYGAGGNARVAAQTERDIESAWNGQSYTDPATGTTYTVKVDVTVRYVGQSVNNVTAENRIELVPGFQTPNAGPSGIGTWDPLQSASTTAHEFGHLAGLRDDYFEGSRGGVRVTPSFVGHRGHMMGGTSRTRQVDNHEVADMVGPTVRAHNRRWFPQWNRVTSRTQSSWTTPARAGQ